MFIDDQGNKIVRHTADYTNEGIPIAMFRGYKSGSNRLPKSWGCHLFYPNIQCLTRCWCGIRSQQATQLILHAIANTNLNHTHSLTGHRIILARMSLADHGVGCSR